MEEKILEMLMEQTEAGKTTYSDVNNILEGLRKKMVQKLLDKEFEEHMKYKKGSHEEKTKIIYLKYFNITRMIRLLCKQEI